MTLDNLVGLSLEKIEMDEAAVRRLLDAAALSLRDAQLDGLSPEGRFDLAYKAIMQTANAALQANGYRTLTSKPGHHQTMVQSLARTIGLEHSNVILLDKLRKQRNDIDYTGEVVSKELSQMCLREASTLYTRVCDHIVERKNAVR